MGSSPAQVSIDWKLLLCTVCSEPSDWQLNHAPLHPVKPPLDLKLISDFAGSPPAERSGRGIAVRMRIPPGKAGGMWGAQTMGKGRCGRAARGLHVCCSGRDFILLNAGGAANSRAAPRSPLWERWCMAREQAGQGPSQPDMRTNKAGHLCEAAGGRTTQVTPWSQTNRQGDKGWPTELILWHVTAGGGGRRNANLIGYYESLNDLVCADKYYSLSACARKESKNIPVFLFCFCWLLCLDSVRLFLGREILLAKEYQGGSIYFSKSLRWSLFLPFLRKNPNIMWTFFAPVNHTRNCNKARKCCSLQY